MQRNVLKSLSAGKHAGLLALLFISGLSLNGSPVMAATPSVNSAETQVAFWTPPPPPHRPPAVAAVRG